MRDKHQRDLGVALSQIAASDARHDPVMFENCAISLAYVSQVYFKGEENSIPFTQGIHENLLKHGFTSAMAKEKTFFSEWGH